MVTTSHGDPFCRFGVIGIRMVVLLLVVSQIIKWRVVPITSDSLAQWTVSLILAILLTIPNDIYHLCIGVGVNVHHGKDNNESLFILPYTAQQDEDGELPFYYKFAVVDHFDRQLKFHQDAV